MVFRVLSLQLGFMYDIITRIRSSAVGYISSLKNSIKSKSYDF